VEEIQVLIVHGIMIMKIKVEIEKGIEINMRDVTLEMMNEIRVGFSMMLYDGNFILFYFKRFDFE
jgi:hypothetical protein